MHKVQHVYRRGDVYYWQRRLPKQRILDPEYGIDHHHNTNNGIEDPIFYRNNRIDDDVKPKTSKEYKKSSPGKIQHCLHTRELYLAKQRASLLTAFSEVVFREYRQSMLSDAQVVAMIQEFGIAFTRDLDAAALRAKQRTDFNIDSEEANEKVQYWLYKLFAAHGNKVKLRDRDRLLMAQDGLGLKEIAAVEQSLCDCEYRADKFIEPGKIEAALNKHGIEYNTSNYFEVRQAYFRAGAQVLKDSGRRWQGEFAEDAQLLSQAITAEVQPYSYQIRSMSNVGIRSNIEISAEPSGCLNSNLVCRRRLLDKSVDLSKGVFWPMITTTGVNNGAKHESGQRCS